MRKNELFDGNGNVIESVDDPHTEEELSAHLAKYREQVILNGFTMFGIPFKGDDKTMLRLAGARIKAEADSDFTTKWGGVVDLTAIQIIQASDAMAELTDKAFKAYGEINPSDYDTIEDLETAFDAAYNGE